MGKIILALGWTTAYAITALLAATLGALIQTFTAICLMAVSKCTIGSAKFYFTELLLFAIPIGILAFAPLDPFVKKFAFAATMGFLAGFLWDQRPNI
ncbi:MAG: hypothetical protein Q7S36_01925 [Candidatus Liptonbacteria bacterium]|nr:hypothetical protein [Candidatus Liptonbacteria bacterium]